MSTASVVRRPVTSAWRRIPGAWRQPLTVVGLVVVAAWLVVALMAPWIAPYDPLAQGQHLYQAPSSAHLLGTDELGRDVLSRVLWGARISIPLAMLLVVLAFLIGGTLGGLAGYLGGWVDELVMRGADFVFAVPTILLAMAVVAALGPGLFHAVLAVVLVSWPGHARVVRGLVRTIMQSEYVAVGRLLGSPTHAALETGNAILLLSALSFLGLGARPPDPEWGSMVSTGAQHFEAWWIGVFPGIAIVSIVLAFNFLGDSLRDAFDPKTIIKARGA